jgi:hypothetical protein
MVVLDRKHSKNMSITELIWQAKPEEYPSGINFLEITTH